MLRVRRSPVVLVGSLALSVVLATVLVPSASAASLSGSGGGASSLSEALSVPVTRNLVWIGWPSQSAAQAIRISSESVGAPQPDEFQITYSNGTFRLDYEHQAGGPVTASYELTVKNIVEVSALTEDGMVSGDSIVSTVPLGAAAFGQHPIQVSETATSNGTLMYSFLIMSDAGNLAMNLTIAEGFVMLPDGQILTPMEAKLTFEFSYDLVHSGSHVALQLGVRTGNRVQMANESWDDVYHFSRDDRALNVTNTSVAGFPSAFFSWSSTASVNGQTGPVTATFLTNELGGGEDLYLAYPAAPAGTTHLVVVHDPTLGVVSTAYASLIGLPTPPSLTADAALYVATAVGIVALVGVTTLLVRRRSR